MNLNAFFRSTKFRVLLCVLALLTGVMLYSLKSGAHTDAVTRGLQWAVSPVRNASAAISGSVSDKLDTYYQAKAYREENERLRDRIAVLNEQLIGYDDAMHELEALRDQLAIKEKDSDFVLSTPCKVLVPFTNDMTAGFRIDQGEEDGITLNAPVICSHGLIGVVTELSAHAASVTTILSPELSVGAVVLETGDSGIVEGDLRDTANGNTRMMYLDEHSTVKSGSLVMTAGTTGLFPYGLAIGNVLETGMEESGLAQYAIIRPAVSLEDLDSVSVLLDFDGKGESFGEE